MTTGSAGGVAMALSSVSRTHSLRGLAVGQPFEHRVFLVGHLGAEAFGAQDRHRRPPCLAGRRETGRGRNPHRVNTLPAGDLKVSAWIPSGICLDTSPRVAGANLLAGRRLTAMHAKVSGQIPDPG
jgi:hypothetical protein